MFPEGTMLGNYKILGTLGSGGMADVYDAEDQTLGRRVALKVLPPEFGRNPQMVMRFEKEIRSAASLNHSGIVTVFEVGRAEGVHYYSMRLLTGGDLRSRIDKGLSDIEALTILREVTDAFSHAHTRGFVHRDVKPENIMFDEQGRSVLTDFGIAKAIASETKMTATGVSIGTPRYISPEQARGRTVDARADLYSLGVILYEMLTGKPPFDADDSLAVIFKHVTEPIPRLPDEFSKYQPLVDSLMAKEPAQRPTSAAELLQLIDPFLPNLRTGAFKPFTTGAFKPTPFESKQQTIVTSEREHVQRLAKEEQRQQEEALNRQAAEQSRKQAEAAEQKRRDEDLARRREEEKAQRRAKEEKNQQEQTRLRQAGVETTRRAAQAAEQSLHDEELARRDQQENLRAIHLARLKAEEAEKVRRAEERAVAESRQKIQRDSAQDQDAGAQPLPPGPVSGAKPGARRSGMVAVIAVALALAGGAGLWLLRPATTAAPAAAEPAATAPAVTLPQAGSEETARKQAEEAARLAQEAEAQKKRDAESAAAAKAEADARTRRDATARTAADARQKAEADKRLRQDAGTRRQHESQAKAAEEEARRASAELARRQAEAAKLQKETEAAKAAADAAATAKAAEEAAAKEAAKLPPGETGRSYNDPDLQRQREAAIAARARRETELRNKQAEDARVRREAEEARKKREEQMGGSSSP